MTTKLNNLHKLLFRVKPLKVILSLRDGPKYPSLIAKEIECTYSHLMKILNAMEKNGLIEFNKNGRIKVITLTKRGEEIFRTVRILSEKLTEIKE